ncbi:acetyl-CoA carboxylase carboxyltransferase subunit alpha [Phytoactinopolyspora halotolerans]|uniref:Multifunctional fusion protein n=1 Tax=Phytoactinopolyspora halotolerans TaxID=1981512 RepID=A0A6L9S135_9ACTN|nr:acetyl-CoA carboxylase carboxyltransferase subunit alpha [Phytoactinopolyspora halotolerans]NED99174.1 acetyl-CoA carboxylase carboxyltransferase subunit alpha [Phytoactinopolyspora halotolerans]
MTETLTTAAEATGWSRCPHCSAFLYAKRLDRNLKVCPECQHHMRLTLDERLDLTLDPGTFRMFAPGGADISGPQRADDPLGFVDTKPYLERLGSARKRTGRDEAAVAGDAEIGGRPLVVAALDFAFMGGSIGTVVGDVVVAAAARALDRRVPLLLISASGGARMQQGCLSLMQLARTSQEIARLREAGVLVINLNTHPTFGGATASFSSLGDVVLAEPGSLIGFAGPQVIKQTIREDLPRGFQTAEFLHEHGMTDLVVHRQSLKETIHRLLMLHEPPSWIPEPRVRPGDAPVHGVQARGDGGAHGDGAPGADASDSRAWTVVTRARQVGRPTTLDYVRQMCEDFVELHGDRVHGDDPAIVAGVGRFDGQNIVLIGHQKGHDTAEMVSRNFGMPHPEGYRKAIRLMRHAERFGLPVVTLVDTAGAYPGLAAEERGQGLAIAECITAMSRLRVPVVTVITGEGGSGGALALAAANRVLMLENSYYSVISPEGCSTILWGSAAQASTAAEALRLTADDLLELGVIDDVVAEPAGGAHTDPIATVDNVAAAISAGLAELSDLGSADLVEQRYNRFRAFGRIDQTWHVLQETAA